MALRKNLTKHRNFAQPPQPYCKPKKIYVQNIREIRNADPSYESIARNNNEMSQKLGR